MIILLILLDFALDKTWISLGECWPPLGLKVLRRGMEANTILKNRIEQEQDIAASKTNAIPRYVSMLM